ncbi:MAG: ABC transporter permease [Lachnospiraceae bacterium]|nr:ABC transporter permease [Lachnospiraceae bacterium]
MKSKLSALKFVRNNKKQVWVMLVALSLTFMTMYLINFLLLTTQESFKALCLEQPKRIAFVTLSLETMGVDRDSCSSDEELYQKIDEARNRIMDKLKAHEGIRDVIYTQCLYANYQGIVGGMGYDFPLLEESQIPGFLEHMNAKLIDGRMPEGAGEILVDKKVFHNKKMEIGGYFNESAYGKVFKVVGVLDSDYLTCVGTPQGYTNSGWYMVILCDEENADMAKVLHDIGIETTEYDTLYDAVDWADMYQKEVTNQLDAAILAILVVVMVFLAISILVAYVSFMRSRVNEYCLYASIGFSRRDIYGMMMREIGAVFGISIVIGAVITIGIMILVGHFLLDSLGLVYRYFYPEHLLRLFAAFLAIVGFLQIPVIVTINNIKTMDRMEG